MTVSLKGKKVVVIAQVPDRPKRSGIKTRRIGKERA
jgi:hypothetical protein